ncbi:hypothetical protein ACHHV8_03900 [Paenibacillus sp. TAB 01]|uniref:hypothetical protein n=1 Tax=Paenibacillus sp. TAB 01 TaxID=3368988 RepID=UPI0037536BF3
MFQWTGCNQLDSGLQTVYFFPRVGFNGPGYRIQYFAAHPAIVKIRLRHLSICNGLHKVRKLINKGVLIAQ